MDTTQAIKSYEHLLNVARKNKDRPAESFALGDLGGEYYSLDMTSKAIECWEQQLTITREIGNRRDENTTLWNLSMAWDKLGARTKAIQLAEAALKILEQIGDPWAREVRKQLAEWRAEKK
jgi:tetratricopeptide (TPR) repeat protein